MTQQANQIPTSNTYVDPYAAGQAMPDQSNGGYGQQGGSGGYDDRSASYGK